MTPDRTSLQSTRRRLLAAGAAGSLTALSGCVREVRNIIRRSPDQNLSLSIATVPEDADPQATQLAMELQDSLEIAGIETTLSFLPRVEFYRQILINHEFDLFVGRHPGGTDPDFLYEALHSRFADEWGWQNPFGFTSIAFDDRLDDQRERNGSDRVGAVSDVLLAIGDEQPFSPLCRPIERRLVDTDRFAGWDEHHLCERLAYASLEPDDDNASLHGIITDARPTENLNPLSVEYRDRQTFIDLLYDSLATRDGDELVPWLAEEWEWDGRTATVELRATSWHDGEPLTAEDVAFTYRFLEDTSLGENDVPSPAPIYRGRASAIDRIQVTGSTRIELTAAGGTEAAENAFTIPILPEHVWRERTDEASVAGIDSAEGTTTAVVTDNVEPVGSGLYEFEARSERSSLELGLFDDHFANTAFDLPTPSVESLRFDVAPSSGAAIEAVETGETDVTVSPLDPRTVGEDELPDHVGLLETDTTYIYCIGYNTRTSPLGNPYFRQTVASLVDKAHLVETVFDGSAEPIASPIGEPWLPESLEWRDTDPLTPFLGSDGELNEPAVRRAFEDLGYRYDEDGALLVRN